MKKVLYIPLIKVDNNLKLLNDLQYETEEDKKMLIDSIQKDLIDTEIKKIYPNTKWGYVKLEIKEKDICWIGEIE